MSQFDWNCLPACPVSESELAAWQVEAKQLFARRYARQGKRRNDSGLALSS